MCTIPICRPISRPQKTKGAFTDTRQAAKAITKFSCLYFISQVRLKNHLDAVSVGEMNG